MKLSWSFIFSSLYCSAVASKAGHVFIYDPIVQPAKEAPLAVSPETARLILAQRLGVSRYHSIDPMKVDTFSHISKYAGIPQKLFLGQEDFGRNEAHVLVWIEDVDDIEAVIKDQAAYTSAFTITDPPSSSANDRLIQDFILQAESLSKKRDHAGIVYETGIKAEAAWKPIKKAETYNDYLSIFRAGKSDRLDATQFSKILHELVHESSRAAQNGWGMTVILMPTSASKTKRAANPYGAYALPAAVEARREKTEALLSPSSSQPSTAPQGPNVSDAEDSPLVSQANEDRTVLGILPACFSTIDKCVNQTNSCSGHGKCIDQFADEHGKDVNTRFCYRCECKPTVEYLDDTGMEEHKKVTYWGGPACQKKDVSQPFWLFVGTGVILAFLISSGIGMLYSMGSEELPSVIGAGVSGPTRK